MSDERITSLTNPTIKQIVKLRERRERDRTGLFVVEGRRELERAAAGGVEFERIFVCPELGTVSLPDGAPVTEVDAAPFGKASYRDTPDGVLAVARQFDLGLDRLSVTAGALLLVVEGLEKPGNLGAVLRSAAAFGVDCVLVADTVVDLFNPNVIRSSLGTVFTVPVGVGSGDAVVEFLRDHHVRWLATSQFGDTAIWDADLVGKVALVIGSEQSGLTERWLADPRRVVTVPTTSDAGSLNASATAAIVLAEAARQRR